MSPTRMVAIRQYIEQEVIVFHDTRLHQLQRLQFSKVFTRRNPYLFRAKNLLVASDVVQYAVDSFVTSGEETQFGNLLERVAVHICYECFGGVKPTDVPSIDLEFERENVFYTVSIKSGPNWGNSDQKKRMGSNFRDRITQLQRFHSTVVAVNGVCYGKSTEPQQSVTFKQGGQTYEQPYLKLCGQQFWEHISGIDTLYVDIIEPLGHRAKEKTAAFERERAALLNRFTHEFTAAFCNSDGSINWSQLVSYGSAR